MSWSNFKECIHSADDNEEIIACIADFHEREPTGLSKDIVGICRFSEEKGEVEACLSGAVQALSLIGSPEKNDYITEYQSVEDTVVEIDNYKRALRD